MAGALWALGSNEPLLDALVVPILGVTVRWVDVSSGDVLSGVLILVFLGFALIFYLIDAKIKGRAPAQVIAVPPAVHPADSLVTKEDRRLREIAQNDYQQLGNRMIVTNPSVDYSNLNALAPYIDLVIQGLNFTVYTVAMGASIQGRIEMRGHGYSDVELQDSPRLIEGGPNQLVGPHETFRMRLRQPLTREIANHLLYERAGQTVSFSFAKLEVEIAAETVVSTGRRHIGLPPIGGEVPHFANLPDR